MHGVKKIVIAGGGTAGWMCAAALSKLLGKNLDITLVESDEIGTVGVGEATIPTLHIFHELLGINEREFMSATNATIKLGISFENWKDLKEDYLHSFGFLGTDCWAAQFHHFWLKANQLGMAQPIGDYCVEHLATRVGRFGVHPNQERNHAYHLDASLYAKFLKGIADKFGVKRREGKIVDVKVGAKDGNIQSLSLDSGEVIEGDLFIDCTGFRGLLIEDALHTGYDDWSHWLPCDRAIAVQTTAKKSPALYTRSIAHDAGWQWQIPLQSRMGNGMVFCSKYWTDEQALAVLKENLTGECLNEPRVIPFRTGTRRLHWNKNCVALGLASGFIEPLESTSIHLIQRSIVKLMLLFPKDEIKQADRDEFNRQTREELEHIRDFIVLHYRVTDRTDTPFWRHCKQMAIPDTLQHRLSLFDETGRLYKYDKDLFGEASWVQVMLGQGVSPKSYHPIVDLMGRDELNRFMSSNLTSVQQSVDAFPLYSDFLKKYCPYKDEGLDLRKKNTIESVKFSFNKESLPVITPMGLNSTPIVLLDSVTNDGGAALRQIAKTLDFEFDTNTMYPGVRAQLPREYVLGVLDKMDGAIRQTYKIPPTLKTNVVQASFSLLTQEEKSLTPFQKVPHFDSTNPYFFAILHYLSTGDHGGTGFFRHEPTNLESIDVETKALYMNAINQSAKSTGFGSEGYIKAANDEFDLYHQVDYRTDRLVSYPGSLLHSTVVKPELDIGWDVDTGRLTANIFIVYE
ncbi:DUF6445 family protein [Saccharophagus degradans]|uniref:Tryptophan halogenase n=1 Tax=Saccharophagus degradans (strain 2-40 / ATCC 43961 / DSM 17024) TaxID=203122 RepID=Q21LR3_SACD2|nr:tryptophan halogenase [Saccharophagus degradans 2-40]